MANLSQYDSRKLKERFLAKLEQELDDVDFIIDIASDLEPEDVFTTSQLDKWAGENGYVQRD